MYQLKTSTITDGMSVQLESTFSSLAKKRKNIREGVNMNKEYLTGWVDAIEMVTNLIEKYDSMVTFQFALTLKVNDAVRVLEDEVTK